MKINGGFLQRKKSGNKYSDQNLQISKSPVWRFGDLEVLHITTNKI